MCGGFTKKSGFTLIELSISVVVISLFIAGAMSMQNQRVREEKQSELDRRLDAIGEALYRYRLVYNKLPCPASFVEVGDTASFGITQENAPEECGGYISNPNVYKGAVPVRTLGLPDDMAFDPWGRYLSYYLDKEVNNASNFVGVGGTAGLVDTDSLNARDANLASIGDVVFAAVVSHGVNGHGAINAQGQTLDSGITNIQEIANCTCGSYGAIGHASVAVYPSSIPLSATDVKEKFDDTVRYFTRRFFYTPAERQP